MINVIFNDFDYEITQKKMEIFDKYNKVIQWGRRHPVKFMELYFGLEFTDHQKYILLSTWTTKTSVWLMSRNSGKALSLDTPVFVPIQDRGDKYPKKTIGDLKIGDKIYDSDGKLTEVIHLNPIIFDDVYEVEFEDGEIIKCNVDHLWSVYDKNFNKRRTEKILCERHTGFLYDNFKIKYKNNDKKIEYRFHVPCTKPIEYPNIQKLPISPYLLGSWLGDGIGNTNRIVCHKDDVDEVCSYFEQEGHIVSKVKNKEKNTYYIIIDREKDFVNEGYLKNIAKQKSFLSKIKQLDLYKNKHIPNCYIYAPIKDRISLLQGLFDTDGCVNKNGTCEFSQVNKKLIEQVSQILSSLGIKNNITYKETNYIKKDGTKAYTYKIHFRNDKNMPLFKLKRKYDRLPDELNSITKMKAIVDVRKTGEKKAMRCITVSNDTGLFLCGNNYTITHNSYLSAPYMMARSILIPNHHTYIMCPAGNQAQETFGKLEDLAKGNIQSITGATKVFWNELVKSTNGSDGFIHDKTSYHCELYNGSSISTLNSVAKNIVGIRSNLNFYDEAGKVDRDYFALTEPFCTQDTNFITGKNLNIDCYPKQLPNQIIYSSSAESMDSQLYDQYKLCALNMIAGDPDYFACDITCELSLHPMKDGKPYRPLLDQSKVDDALKKNEFRANREYFNKFDLSGGQDALVRRTTIIANSFAYHPVFENEDNESTYIITYDPSTKLDNSFVLISQLFIDEEKGYMIKLVGAFNLIEITPTGDKKVIQKPEQIEIIKQLILKYNGNVPDYENLERIIIDAGSGGGGFDIAQFLLKEWKGSDGMRHMGLIDLEDKYLKEERVKFPSAIDKLTMANFTADKVKMYTDTQDMINQGLVMFPKSLNLRSEMEFEIVDGQGNVTFQYEPMGDKEIAVLTELDLLKEELVGMQKTKQGSNIRFDTMPSKKAQGMHDDRADCCAMACHLLATIRREKMLDVGQKKKEGFNKYFSHVKTNLNNSSNNPFGNTSNPFNNEGPNPFLNY